MRSHSALRKVACWRLARADLLAHGEAGRAAATELDARPAHVLASRLRLSAQRHADTMSLWLAELEARREFGRLFVATVAVVALSILRALSAQAPWPGLDPHSDLLNRLLLLLLAVPMMVRVRMSRRPLADFGLSWQRGRRAAAEGLAWGLAGAVLIAAAQAAWSPAGLRLNWNPSLLAHPLHGVIREFVNRGVIQSSLQRRLDDRRGWVSVVPAALLFGLAHMICGLGAIAVTIISGIATGALYRRHGNLFGVSVLHTVVGLAALVTGVIRAWTPRRAGAPSSSAPRRAAADFVIGKPGPGLISEALAVGLPLILEFNAWTLVQERHNARRAADAGVARVVSHFRQVGAAAAALLQALRADRRLWC